MSKVTCGKEANDMMMNGNKGIRLEAMKGKGREGNGSFPLIKIQ